MNRIDNLTTSAAQQTTLLLPDGTAATITLHYHGATERWVMDVTYGTHTINGIGVAFHANLLRQWESILPFGIACITADQTDPFLLEDFSNGRANLYLLSPADVVLVERTVFGRVI